MQQSSLASLAERYQTIMQDIGALGQPPRPLPVVIAACKHQPPQAIKDAYDAGIRHFGENRQQDMLEHWQDRRTLYPDVTVHFIGQIQSKKLPSIVQYCDVIHTLDRVKLVEQLAVLRDEKKAKLPRLLVQVNLGGESQKGGILKETLPYFLKVCQDYSLMIEGLMTLPPVDENPAPFFQTLATLAKAHNLPHLSMGMSEDYPAAIAAGSTMIRLGRALFA
ncbi:MAG: YggS family pyridoxal phosphate-dependent enzyme, partial [Alphaproteobacteria bacterium]